MIIDPDQELTYKLHMNIQLHYTAERRISSEEMKAEVQCVLT